MARPLPWEDAAHLPWKAWMSPAEQWQHMPSFAIGQALFFALAALSLWHAWRKGRGHLVVWAGALIAGTANDFIFMALPLVDNFWQAQGIWMLTPRMPAYIPMVYVCFLYIPTVTARRLRLPPVATATIAGLLAILFYAPYDIVGAKFLWWTWHDTDKPIAARILGAPCSSSLWVITFTASFCWLVDKALRNHEGDDGEGGITAAVWAKGLLLVAAFTTALMMVQMTILQQLDGGTPGTIALSVTAVLYPGLFARKWSSASPRPAVWADKALTVALLAHFTAFIAIMALFDPATHVSEGVHQEVGKCYVEAKDITGLTRHEFLCAKDFEEDYTFDCAKQPADGAQWYTICGKAHSNKAAWLGGVLLLGVVGGAAFFRLRR